MSASVAKDKVVVGINRKKLNGAMIARLTAKKHEHHDLGEVEDTMVPVIGVSLNRQ